MKHHVAFMTAVACAVTAACGGGDAAPDCSQAEDVMSPVDAEACAIYSSIIGKDYAGSGMIVIGEYAGYKEDATPEYLQQVLGAASDETRADFAARNADLTVQGFLKQFTLPRYELLCRTKEDYFIGADHWGDFYETYQGAQGILSLAVPGFNTARDEAIVYLRNTASATSGEGYFVTLKKEAGAWNTKLRVRTWQE